VFDAALENAQTDDQILAWLKARVPAARRDDANAWLLEEKSANLDRQDEEEGVVVA
jgi:hypothetical protein